MQHLGKPFVYGCGAVAALALSALAQPIVSPPTERNRKALSGLESKEKRRAAPSARPIGLNLGEVPGRSALLSEEVKTIHATRNLVKKIKTNQDSYERDLTDFLEDQDLSAWDAVKRAAYDAMRAVHRFAYENLAMWETVTCRLQQDTKEQLTWQEAMEGFCLEDRVEWLQKVQAKVQAKVTACLAAHQKFRENVLSKYKQRLKDAETELQNKYERVWRSSLAAVAVVGVLAKMYSYRPKSAPSSSDHVLSFLLISSVSSLVTDGPTAVWEWLMQDDEDSGCQDENIRAAERYLQQVEGDMSTASSHLLAADVRYEQFCETPRCGKEPGKPAMRLNRKDLLPAIQRLSQQELQPLIALCQKYTTSI
eukprot:g41116.t1